MLEYCTCGARLVEDARFCHKCGRPVREEALVEISEAESAVPPPLPDGDAHPSDRPAGTPAPLPEIGFQNNIAVRIAALIAGPAYLLIGFAAVLPGGGLLVFPGLLASGFVSVALYRRRSGQQVSLSGGARMGWLNGIFIFLISLILLTLKFVLSPAGDLTKAMQEQLKQQGQQGPEVQAAIEMMTNPAAILLILAVLFMFVTTLPSIGGALGAKLLQDKSEQ